MARRARQIANPGCLGQIAEKYGRYCSQRCPTTALCVLMLMGEYLRREHKVPPSQQSTGASERQPIPPDEPQ